MFKKKWPGKIISDSGFELHIIGRGSLLYKQGSRIMKINSELLASNFGIGIYKNSIQKWEPPFENEIISKEKRQQILNNIKDALAFKNINAEFC